MVNLKLVKLQNRGSICPLYSDMQVLTTLALPTLAPFRRKVAAVRGSLLFVAVFQLVARSLGLGHPVALPKRAPWQLPLRPKGAERETDYAEKVEEARRRWMTLLGSEENQDEAQYQETVLIQFHLTINREMTGWELGSDDSQNELVTLTRGSGRSISGGTAETSGVAGTVNGDGKRIGGPARNGRTLLTLRRGQGGRTTGCGRGR